jgi:hypothetical protein
MFRSFLALFLFLTTLQVVAQVTTDDCLSYQPVITELLGHITRRPVLGPPGFGEDPKHDSREMALILQLDQPVCVRKGVRVEDSDEFNVKEIQLALVKEVWKLFNPVKKQVGTKRRFKVIGELYHAQTGHHITPVVMLVKSITLTSSLTLRSTRTPPAMSSALSHRSAFSAPLSASAQAGPVSFNR